MDRGEDSSEDEGGPDNEEQWDEWESNTGEDATRSLFSPQILGSPEEAMDHDAQHHGFDLRHYIVKVRQLGHCS